jgi:hypothetical protein
MESIGNKYHKLVGSLLARRNSNSNNGEHVDYMELLEFFI